MAEKGVYLLLLALPTPHRVPVGRLGLYHFPAGYYLYAGSALGSGGLAARLGRHARQEKSPHWHIDYLRPLAQLESIWLQVTPHRVECDWAAAARRMPHARVPAPRFGASDCRCPAHLIHLPERPRWQDFAAAAGLDPARIEVLKCDEAGTFKLFPRALHGREGLPGEAREARGAARP